MKKKERSTLLSKCSGLILDFEQEKFGSQHKKPGVAELSVNLLNVVQ